MQVYTLHGGTLPCGICSKAGCQSSQANGLLESRSLIDTAYRAHNYHRKAECSGKAEVLVQVPSTT